VVKDGLVSDLQNWHYSSYHTYNHGLTDDLINIRFAHEILASHISQAAYQPRRSDVSVAASMASGDVPARKLGMHTPKVIGRVSALRSFLFMHAA